MCTGSSNQERTIWPIEKWLSPFYLEDFGERWESLNWRQRKSIRREQRAILRKFGLIPSRLQTLGPPLVLIITLVLACTLFGWSLLNFHRSAALNVTADGIGRSNPTSGAEFITALAAIGAFVFGYQQWRSARYEKSMEDFYSRLNLANQRRESVKLVSRLLGHPWDLNEGVEVPPDLDGHRDHRWSMYVYTELDNLEYVIEKYRLGYMQERHALRGLRTFYQRCAREPFRDRACKCVRCMAYNESTIRVVDEVCKDIETRISGKERPDHIKPLAPPPAPPWRKLARQFKDKAAL